MGSGGAKVGVQLYTLRELTAQDMAGTLEAVAEMGYDGVELAGYGDLTAPDAASTCGRLGLEVGAAHISLDRFEAEPAAVAAELRLFGTDNLVIPWVAPDSDVEAVAGRMAAVVEQARSLDLRPSFHNHWFEWDPRPSGRTLWDALEAIDGLWLELDLGWAWAARRDQAELLRAASGRCALAHLKDMRREGDEVRDTPLGDGEIDWPMLVPLAKSCGVEWLVVEQDHPGDDPLGAVRRSFDYLRSLPAAA